MRDLDTCNFAFSETWQPVSPPCWHASCRTQRVGVLHGRPAWAARAEVHHPKQPMWAVVPLIGRARAGRRFWNPCLRRRVGCLRLQAESDCVRPCAACCIRSAGTVLSWVACAVNGLPAQEVHFSTAGLCAPLPCSACRRRFDRRPGQPSLVLSDFRVSISIFPGRGGFLGFPSWFVNLTKYGTLSFFTSRSPIPEPQIDIVPRNRGLAAGQPSGPTRPLSTALNLTSQAGLEAHTAAHLLGPSSQTRSLSRRDGSVPRPLAPSRSRRVLSSAEEASCCVSRESKQFPA